MSPQRLSSQLVDTILQRFGQERQAPDLPSLTRLISAYVCHVPWESASRIVRRALVQVNEDAPSWPVQFWQRHLAQGTGGTCFESNYAFWTLLRSLGFDAYLTVNDMGDTCGCHTAIIARIGADKWLVDAGLPLFCPIMVSPGQVTEARSHYLNYRALPVGECRYEIERYPHPMPNAFTLIDVPVDEAAYQEAVIADYGADGFFLDCVIINKIVDGLPMRFNGREMPAALNAFWEGQRTDMLLNGDIDLELSDQFGIARAIIRQALALTAGPKSAK